MSSVSNEVEVEVDVIRTRIPTYDDDDNTVLYAYETITSWLNNQQSATPGIYHEVEQRKILDVVSHCQVIYDAIQNLDKKINVIRGKVAKIHRLRAKTFYTYRKPLGYPCKNYGYLIARKLKLQKMKKEQVHSSFSNSESYSPTIPVRRPDGDVGNDLLVTSLHFVDPEELAQDPMLREPDEIVRATPPLPVLPGCAFQAYNQSDDAMPETPVVPYFAGPGAQSDGSLSPTVPVSRRPHGGFSPMNDSELKLYSTQESRHTGSSPNIPSGFATSSPADFVRGVLREQFFEDPSAWSVEDVILFLKYTDPQLSDLVVDVFREHEIDGKALLLLNHEMMIKYLGVKLGTALRLCYYVDKLKEEKPCQS